MDVYLDQVLPTTNRFNALLRIIKPKSKYTWIYLINVLIKILKRKRFVWTLSVTVLDRTDNIKPNLYKNNRSQWKSPT